MARPLKIVPPLALTGDRYINSGARISADGKYRYHLWREWRAQTDVEEMMALADPSVSLSLYFSSCLIRPPLTAKQMIQLFGDASAFAELGDTKGSKSSIYLPIGRQSRLRCGLSRLRAAILSAGRTLRLLETPAVTLDWSSVLGARTVILGTTTITSIPCAAGCSERNTTLSALRKAASRAIRFMSRRMRS